MIIKQGLNSLLGKLLHIFKWLILLTMQQNIFYKALSKAITEFNELSNRGFAVDALIRAAEDRLTKEREGFPDSMLWASALAFRDPTAPDELYMPIRDYFVNQHTLKDEVAFILNRQLLLLTAQAYEALESYLYTQVAEFIKASTTTNIFVTGEQKAMTIQSIRSALKTLNDRQHNKHLIRILRANCKHFDDHEESNLLGINYRHWFEMFGEVRDVVTHQRMEIHTPFNERYDTIRERYFGIELGKEISSLTITISGYRELMSVMAGYTTFIYAAVSKTIYGVEVDYYLLEEKLSKLKE